MHPLCNLRPGIVPALSKYEGGFEAMAVESPIFGYLAAIEAKDKMLIKPK
jgi:hypothetical protein